MAEKPDFNTMTRNDLNTYATEHGVSNPESYGTKVELVNAIEQAASAAPEGEQPPAEGETPPAEGEEPPAATAEVPEPLTYEPITPEDDEENPVAIELPKTDEEVAEEGTQLGLAEAAATGGVVPFASAEPQPNKRIWALDASFNTNERGEGQQHGREKPDYVEAGS